MINSLFLAIGLRVMICSHTPDMHQLVDQQRLNAPRYGERLGRGMIGQP